MITDDHNIQNTFESNKAGLTRAIRAFVDAGGEALVNNPTVRHLVGDISNATLYRLLANGQFPKPIAISPGRRAWCLSSVQAWIKQRIDESDANASIDH